MVALELENTSNRLAYDDGEISFKTQRISSSSDEIENTSEELELSPNTKVDSESLRIGRIDIN